MKFARLTFGNFIIGIIQSLFNYIKYFNPQPNTTTFNVGIFASQAWMVYEPYHERFADM